MDNLNGFKTTLTALALLSPYGVENAAAAALRVRMRQWAASENIPLGNQIPWRGYS